jgi:hypothetical protein
MTHCDDGPTVESTDETGEVVREVSSAIALVGST